MHDSETLAAIREVVASGNPRRARVRREGWAQIRQLLGLDEVIEVPAEADSDGGEKSGEVDLTVLTVKELKALADERGIDLGGVKSKADIIAAIEAAEADSDGGGDEAESDEDDDSDED